MNTTPPTPTGIEAQVCTDIAVRQQHGINKYGHTVAHNPLDLLEWLQHAYEESLDFSIYLKRAQAELGAHQSFRVEQVNHEQGGVVLQANLEAQVLSNVKVGDHVVLLVLSKAG